MLNAILVGNPQSASGHRLAEVDVEGRWFLNPGELTTADLEDADLIALFGGDGTMQITLSQLLEQTPADRLPPIALVPFGTTNMNARDLNRARTRQASVASLRDMVQTGQLDTVSRPLVRVTDGDHVRHGFFFGMGVIAEVVQRWNEQRKPGPFANQLRSLWAMITGLAAVSSTTDILLDGRSLSVYGLLATTLDRLLFGSRPYWGTAEPGNLRLTWVASDADRLIRHAPALLRGREYLANRRGYESSSADHASLAFDGPYIIDGEIFEPQDGRIQIDKSEPLRWIRL